MNNIKLLVETYVPHGGETFEDCCGFEKTQSELTCWVQSNKEILSIQIDNNKTLMINKEIARTLLRLIEKGYVCDSCHDTGVISVVIQDTPELITELRECPKCVDK